MSGPEDGRGGDAFGDFFGEPSPSGRMRPDEQHPKSPQGDQPTEKLDIGGGEATPPQPTPAAEPPHEPTIAMGAVPESWWTPEPEASAAATGSTWDATPTPPQERERPPRKRISPLGLVTMLVGGVLLGGLCVGGVMALGEDGEPAAQETVTETSSSTQDETSDEGSSSSSTTAERSGKAPSGVSKCAGPAGGVAVGTGSDVTSCEFAVAVRDAYVAGGSSGAASLSVTSPVTDKEYSMSCSGEAVTRCTGGNNAVVVLF